MIEYFYALGTLTLAQAGPEQSGVAQLDQLWRRSFAVVPCPPVAVPALAIHWQTAAPLPPPVGAPCLTYQRLQIWEVPSGFHLHLGDTALDLDLAHGRATGVLGADWPALSLNEQREFFRLTFYLLLRRQGYFGLHANGLAWGEQGVVMAATSGSGKTTFTLSLLRAGWRYVADDALLLAQQGEQVVAHGLRRDCSCTPETLALFPHLQAAVAGTERLARDKRTVSLAAIYGAQYTTRCVPRLLLFPTIGAAAHTTLISLPPLEAISQLIARSPGMLINKAAVQEQMVVLKTLLQQAQSYRVVLGEDVFTAPEQVSQLLQEQMT